MNIYSILCSEQIGMICTRSSSRDEIANVNFLYDDIVHVLQNTIDSRMNSATGRRSRSFEVNNFGTNRKLIKDFLLVINTNLLSCTVSKLWLIIGQIFASMRVVPHFNALAVKTTFFGLHFCCRKYRIFNHFYVMHPNATEFGEITHIYVRDITPFKVFQGHRVWYQWKAYMRLPVLVMRTYLLSCIVSEI